MSVHELQSLLDYHYWARDRVLDAAEALTAEQFTKDLGNSFPSIRDTLVHVYSADCVWYSRWEGKPLAGMLDASAFPDVATLRTSWSAHEINMRAFLDGLGVDGVGRLMEYRGFNGQPQAQVFWQMLQHVVNHGTYHRGQATTMMRQLGATPPLSMDLIAFYREQQASAAAR